jgi:hypothetical protein
MSRKMIATTRRMWSHPPSMVDVIIPRNQSTTSRMTRNISIVVLPADLKVRLYLTARLQADLKVRLDMT